MQVKNVQLPNYRDYPIANALTGMVNSQGYPGLGHPI